MSRYRDSWFWQAVLSGGDVTVSVEIAKVFADIDARLNGLEAGQNAQQKNIQSILEHVSRLQGQKYQMRGRNETGT